MVRIIFFLIMLPLAVNLQYTNAKARVHISSISINDLGQRTKNGVPYSGEVISYYTNGKVESLEEFYEGRRNGFARKWFDDGVLAYESHYTNGFRNGHTRSWWFNSNKRSETFFKNGKVEGDAWLWYRNGNKFKHFSFKNGQPEGIQQAWRLNGKLFSNFEYKNGRIFGMRKSNNCVGLENDKISVDYYQNQAGMFKSVNNKS